MGFRILSMLMIPVIPAMPGFAFNPLFDTPVYFEVGNHPAAAAASDLNNDGFVDLAVANDWSEDISILLNDGDGLFADAASYQAGEIGQSIVAADFDGDGYNDLAVVGNGFEILVNYGNGSFPAHVNYQTDLYPVSICAADLDGDGDIDIITAEWDSDNDIGCVETFFNNGNGTFQATNIQNLSGLFPLYLAAADLDNDNDSDIAIAADNYGFGYALVMLNNGDGTFPDPVSYGSGENIQGISAADLDGDNDIDLGISCLGGIAVLLNNGNGSFSTAIINPVGDNSGPLFAEDIDGDGDNDFALINFAPSPDFTRRVSVLFNDGNGMFQIIDNYQVGNYPAAVLSSDLDGDNDNDMVVVNWSANGYVTELVNIGSGIFPAGPRRYAAGGNPSRVVAADLDNDGRRDLAVVNSSLSSDDLSILINDQAGGFQDPVGYLAGYYSVSIAASELDGDGDTDLVVANLGSGDFSVLMNNGDGTFQAALNYEAGVSPRSVFAGDLDGDGDNDIIVANFGDWYQNDRGSVTIHFNNGDGTFQQTAEYDAGNHPNSVLAADLNGDSAPDLAVTAFDSITVLLNDGNGTFQQPFYYSAGHYHTSVNASDIDGDGDNDLIITDYMGDHYYVSILMNNADGTFQESVDYEVGRSTVSVFITDLDSDGDKDLALDKGYILLNNGFGTFQISVGYLIGGNGGIVAEDLDGDGDNDVIVTSPSIDAISVSYNLSDMTSAENREEISIPENFSCPGNYPNPFNASTIIEYDLPVASDVTIEIYDILGRRAQILVPEKQHVGHNEIVWNARDFPSGIYFYRLEADDFAVTRKMLLLK